MTADQKVSWRWRVHTVYLSLLGLWWLTAFLSLKNTKSGAASGFEALLVLVAGFGQALATAAVYSMAAVLLLYAVVTTLVMKVLERRALAPVWLHGTIAALVIFIAATSNALDQRRHALEERAASEATTLGDAARAATLACVAVEQVIIHPGTPLKVTVRLAPKGCATFGLEDMTLEGNGAGHRAWISRYFRPDEPISGAREFELVDDDPLEDAPGWTWTLRVRIDEGEQVFCGPGAVSPIPEYLKCRRLAVSGM